MLGLEEASELLVRDLDREVTERLPDETRVFDLLDRARDPEERLEVLSEVGANLVRRRQVVASERVEPGSKGGVHQLLVVAKVHQGVAPVEENCS